MLPPILEYFLMLDRNNVRELLTLFRISLPDETIDKLLVYLNLLLRWNQKINLTSVRTPEECITRHFGESFLLSHVVHLGGRLLDIGSGAGFPGLAVKLIAPQLEVVLLEPRAKKRAFLKEVSRACDMSSVLVLDSRVEAFWRTEPVRSFDIVTARAVGGLESLVPLAADLLKVGGSLCLWAGRQQEAEIRQFTPDLRWSEPVEIPLSHERMVLAGRRVRMTL